MATTTYVTASRLAVGASIALLVAAAVLYVDLDTGLNRDSSFYLYFGERLTAGELPYIDYFETKTPLAIFLAGGAVQVATWLHGDHVIAVRVVFLLVCLLGWWLAWYYAHRRRGPWAWVVLGLVLLTPMLLQTPSSGAFPKAMLVTLAMALPFVLDRQRWFWAGALAGLGFLDWQVGGLLLPGAMAGAWVASRRVDALLRVGAGFAVPLLLLGAFYAWHGGLDTLVRTAVVGAATSEGQSAVVRSLGQRLVQIWAVSWRKSGYAALAPLVMIPLALAQIAVVLRARQATPGVAGALVYAMAMLLMGLIELDGAGDLYPWLGACVLLAAVAGPTGVGEASPLRLVWVPLGCLAAGLVVSAWAESKQPMLADQRRVAAHFGATLPGGRAAVLGFPDLHILARLSNPLPCLYVSPNSHHRLRASPGEDMLGFAQRVVSDSPAWVIVIGRNAERHAPFGRAPLLDALSDRFAVRGYGDPQLCYSLLVRRGTLAERAFPLDASCAAPASARPARP